MLCEKCGLKEAQFTVVEVVSGHRHTHELCEICAEELSMGLGEGVESITLQEEATAGEQTTQSSTTVKKRIIKELVCPGCGLTYEEFLNTAKFGCPECYRAFKENLVVLFKDVQGFTKYKGHMYVRDQRSVKLLQEKYKLEETLSELVSKERFEEAAKIRDRINQIIEELGWA